MVVDNKEIEVLTIAENDKVYIAVDGHTVVLDEDESDSVGGLDVRADDIIYTGKETQKSYVTLTVSGIDAERVVETGDGYRNEDDDEFEWVISTTGDYINYIGVDYVTKANDADEDVLYVGDKLSFAGLFDLAFELDKDYKYEEFAVDFDTATTADINASRIKSLEGKKLVLGDEELDEAWFDGTLVYYKDENNDWVTDSVNTLYLENDDMSYAVDYNVTTGKMTIGLMTLDVSGGFTHFGALDEEAEATDLSFGGSDLGKRDTKVLLEDGAIIAAPEGDLDNDELSFKIPDESVKALVTVGR